MDFIFVAKVARLSAFSAPKEKGKKPIKRLLML